MLYGLCRWSSTKVQFLQYLAVVIFEDYVLKESTCAAHLLIFNRVNGPRVFPVFRVDEGMSFIYLLNQINPSFSVWYE
jgi:hypothetical protein